MTTARGSEAGQKSTRDKLLAAALEAFGDRGFEGVTVREVERDAGVERGLMKYHFGTKLELWTSVVDSLFDRFDSEVTILKQTLRNLRRSERSRALVVAYVHFIARYPEFFRILIFEGHRDTVRSRHVVEHMRASTALWREAAGAVGPPGEDEMVDAFQVLGSTGTIFATLYFCDVLYGFDREDPEFEDRLATIISNTRLTPQGRTLIAGMNGTRSQSSG